ncbi:MAG: peptidylprolyl isomerase [Synechococcaceae cyanobacterium]|nr:peptidylprolyl isomerase [Synechococcaceae cyanobacterium]
MTDPTPADSAPAAAPQAAGGGSTPSSTTTAAGGQPFSASRPTVLPRTMFASPTIELATLPVPPAPSPATPPQPGAAVDPAPVQEPAGVNSSAPAAEGGATSAAPLAHVPRASLPAIAPELWRSLARHGLLLPLLRQSVIAAAVADVQLSEEESLQGRQAWGGANRLGSPEAVVQHLASHGLEEADALWQAELPQRIGRHCLEHFSHRAEQRFLARKNQLDQVIYSLLRVEDASLARELYLRIAEGEADFAELAASYACGPEKATRGIVGPVPLLQAHPTLAEKLRTSRPGELQPPLQIEQWWLVVRLESLRPASFDEEMRRRMAHELFEEWVEQEVRAQLASRGNAASQAA